MRLPLWWWLPSIGQRKLHLQLMPCSVGQGGYRARPGSRTEDTGLPLTEGHSTDREWLWEILNCGLTRKQFPYLMIQDRLIASLE